MSAPLLLGARFLASLVEPLSRILCWLTFWLGEVRRRTSIGLDTRLRYEPDGGLAEVETRESRSPALAFQTALFPRWLSTK